MPTKIPFCDEVFNPVTGCEHTCQWCFARTFARRLQKMPQSAHKYRYGFKPTFHPEELSRPSRWKKPRRIFVCSMGDLFGPRIENGDIERVIEIALDHPRHIFQFLTKQPHRLSDFNPWPPNAWVGTSVTDQSMLNYALPHLAAVDAPVRFLSVEPMLGPVGLLYGFVPEWTIIGRLTGPHAKRYQFDPAWVHALTEQAHRLGSAVFQKDNLADYIDHLIQEFPHVC